MENQTNTLRRNITTDDLSHFAFKGAGTLLLMRGIRGRGLVGAAMALGGLWMLFPETASRIINSVWPQNGHKAQGTPADAPSYRDEGHEAEQTPQDEIDAAAMASFPASDPPSSYRSS
ncbi:MAG: hypothetical protein QM770_09155 [Tepidisphaeraceae bacterium]